MLLPGNVFNRVTIVADVATYNGTFFALSAAMYNVAGSSIFDFQIALPDVT